MRTAAILPVKRFAFAKQRLGASVADALRARLARAMVADVLDALARSGGVELTIVVTQEPEASRAAHALGAAVVQDGAESGQSQAVTLGVRHALAHGFERVLCVPGDCPALDPQEIEGLLEADARGVVVIPDRHGTGTNGLLLAPADAIAPSFGPDSCARHLGLARAASVSVRVERLPSLLLDVDTGDDLEALRGRLLGELAGVGERAPRTRAVLDAPATTGRDVPAASSA